MGGGVKEWNRGREEVGLLRGESARFVGRCEREERRKSEGRERGGKRVGGRRGGGERGEGDKVPFFLYEREESHSGERERDHAERIARWRERERERRRGSSGDVWGV